jgi:hypothetical protein
VRASLRAARYVTDDWVERGRSMASDRQPEPEKPGPRELTLVESPYGFAWGCKACEWFHPLPSFIPEGESPIKIVQLAFDEHDCQHYD